MIYINTLDNAARYCLGEEGSNPLIVFGVNCSTATDIKLDTTLSKVRTFSQKNGYDGWLMFNLYPQRATNPKDLDINCRREWHQNNLKVIQKQLVSIVHPTIWAAWGTTILCRPYLAKCLADIVSATTKHDPRWIHVGSLTKEDHPRHPSRLAYKSKVNDFDIGGYLYKFE